MKRLFIVLLSVVLCLSFTTGCGAEGAEVKISFQIGSPTMTVNGVEKPIDGEGTVPVITDGRTLLPIRAVIEELGGAVGWDGETRTVALELNGDIILMQADSNTAFLNEEARSLDVAPAIINGRTMLPIRFVAESFNLNVEWDGETQTVTITR